MANITLDRDIYSEMTAAGATGTNAELTLKGGSFYGNNYKITHSGSSDYMFFSMNNAAVYDLQIAGNVSTSGYVHSSPLSLHGVTGNLVLRNITSSANITHTAADSENNQGYGNVGGIISKLDAGDGDNTAVLEKLTFTGSITMNGKVTEESAVSSDSLWVT
jgi:hypothetical protein